MLVCLALGALCLTRTARADDERTYVWVDERGVAHAVSDPSEVPEKYRQRALQESGNRGNVSIAKPDAESEAGQAPPAPPTPAAPEPEPKAKHARHKQDEEEPEPPKKPRKVNGLPPASEGFQWDCRTDVEGERHCEQIELEASRRLRHLEAHEKARKQLGVTAADEATDPDLAKKVEKAAEKEYKETTPKPDKVPSESGEGETDDESD
jgi:hypothetical protein